ncbi:hypothetical protein MJO29_010937 [Puccinia striiformis f. sp. tritici]|nr:hypothetical protein MJO29_010937 [Puccinia striiformis f. sp. tritici]
MGEDDWRPLCLHMLPPPGTAVKEIKKTITTSKQNPDKNASSKVTLLAMVVVDLPNLNDSAPVCSSNQLCQHNQYRSLESLILERSLSSELSESEKRASLIAHQDKIVQQFLSKERKR